MTLERRIRDGECDIVNMKYRLAQLENQMWKHTLLGSVVVNIVMAVIFLVAVFD